MKVLFIGSHPDDVELGCGGTMVKHLESGDDVFVLVMTKGEKGNHTINGEECLNSLSKLGIKKSNIIFANFPDGELTDSYETVNFMEQCINKFKITRVYAHSFSDRHQDHRNCSRSASSAARKIPELFLYQGPSTNVFFEPHVFIEISSDQMNKKIESLNCYKTQIEKGIVDLQWVKNIASVNKLGMKGEYAEAFAINHIFIENEGV